MKNFRTLFFLFLLFSSCTKEMNPVIEEKPGFSLRINGNEWTPTEYYYDIKDEGVSVIFATDKVFTFSWTFDSELSEKKYVLGEKENKLISAMYKYEGGLIKAFDILSGELSILDFDSSKQVLKCEFSFSATDSSSKIFNIKDGKLYIDKFR